ncbi:hypothetical protein BDZ45DRAFT_706867 [Acephala macrosclerotiorum]|nr:hypothetical protein BDZ45DRAFT_706867 [Acephala macrosclerotiorum]
MTTRTERFQRKPAEKAEELPKEEEEEVIRFSPEEEASLLEESNTQKTAANDLFAKASFQDAIDTYNKALSTCPNYLDYEIAVLRSNIAACHLKLEDWKEAVKAATAALDGLDKLQGDGKDASKIEEKKPKEEEVDEEIVSEGALKAEDTSDKGKREADIARIRAKALMRRARARSELGGWASLSSAEEDYKKLDKIDNLSVADRNIVKRQLILLPPRTKAAQEKEMGDMMGKLKELGNGILKPFGLSTDNFQMQKDPNTGGYSMNFNQGGPASK